MLLPVINRNVAQYPYSFNFYKYRYDKPIHVYDKLKKKHIETSLDLIFIFNKKELKQINLEL